MAIEEGEMMGLLRKAIGGIGLYASQKKSKAEYSGPCQMCGANGIDLYAYEGKHLCRKCLEEYINGNSKGGGKFRCFDCHAIQPRNAKYCSNCGRPLSLEAMKAARAADDEKFNWVMDEVNDALAELGGSENAEKAMERYDTAIQKAKASGIGLSVSHPLRLVNALIKAGKHDDAWGRLNAMTIEYPDELWKIRKEQCRICKKEKRWEDALQFLAMSYADKHGEFNRQAFEKDVAPIAKKLTLSEAEVRILSDELALLNGSVPARDAAAVDVYRHFHAEYLSS